MARACQLPPETCVHDNAWFRQARIASRIQVHGPWRGKARGAARAMLLGCAFLCALMPPVAGMAQVPTFAQVRRDYLPSDAVLLDRHGQPLQQLRLELRRRRLEWVALADVSPALRLALLVSEDRRFYEHAGVDWQAVAAAAWSNLWNTRTRGASTLTMQLAGLLDDAVRRGAAPRSTRQKLSQVMLAQALERHWRKDQILEAYLNLVSFRGELAGVSALARVLFDKHPSGLDELEAALAVALIRAPNAPPAKVAQRACIIYRQQQAAKAAGFAAQAGSGKAGVSCAPLEGLAALRLAPLAGARAAPFQLGAGAGSLAPQLAPHLARRLLKRGTATLVSSLDAGLQRYARDSLLRHLAALSGRNVEDGAVLVLDNASGEVLAWVGSSGALSGAAEVDGVLALRQAGSTLKPFLYALAIEHKWLTAASVLDDSPLNLPTGAGMYVPQNYDRNFKGPVSLRTALASSLNVPAVRTLVTVTPGRLFARLQQLGFALRESGEYYGYSLALGSADVSLLALVNAYRTLANQGRHGPVRYVPGQGAPAPSASPVSPPLSGQGAVIDPAAAFIIADILADRSARARTFGLENALATRNWSAVKTGTSRDMRDNWCIGFSSRYTVGVWVGNASGAPMRDVSGVTGAAPVWQDIMHYLHAGQAAADAPAVAPGVLALTIRYQDAMEPQRREYFMAGTQQSVIHAVTAADAGAAITSPTDGMLVALDPDMPVPRQRLRFSANAGTRHGAGWRLDGKPLPPAAGETVQARDLAYDWLPWPGKHVLELLGPDGSVQDRVAFEVRGSIADKSKEER